MIVTSYTTDDMKKLPLRAMVAFVARCARRVEHLALPTGGHPEEMQWRQAVAEAIRVVEDFARGLPCPTADATVRQVEACQGFAEGDLTRENAYAAVVRAVHAAATAIHSLSLREEPAERRLLSGGPPLDPLPPHLADVTADLAARDAYTAAADAMDAVGFADGFMVGAGEDYRKLLELSLGEYPEAGQPIDPSAGGPLGPLWPGGRPGPEVRSNGSAEGQSDG